MDYCFQYVSKCVCRCVDSARQLIDKFKESELSINNNVNGKVFK